MDEKPDQRTRREFVSTVVGGLVAAGAVSAAELPVVETRCR